MIKKFSLSFFAVKNLIRKPVRTGILIVAISLLVSTLVFALSFVIRVNSSIIRATDRLGADIIIVPTGSRGFAQDVLLENKRKTFYMDRDIIEKVKQIKGIEDITHQTYLVSLTGLCCSVPEAMVVAFNQDTDFIVKPWLKKKIDRRLRKGEAFVGSTSAFNIEVGLMEVDTMLFGAMFKMIGVLDKTGTGLDNAIFIGDENLDNILKKGDAKNIKPNQISIIFAKIKKGLDPYKVGGDIEDAIVEVDTVARKDIGKGIINTLRDISRIFSFTIIIAILLGLFLVWSIFSAVANERTREIGIMRALGAKESHISLIFLFEVLIIGFAGSILGIVAGTVISSIMTKSFTILKNLSTDLAIFERAFISLTGLLLGVGICVLGAFTPVQRIKKTEPLSIMKGE